MKDASTVVEEFNEIVNMTTSELKSWIETDESKDAGWTGGDGDGETVGHNSATKIIDILEKNPDGVKADKVEEDDLAHMRKVVSYCKRHLAQEGHMVEDKSEQELKASKSYKSLKNWGHDSLKVKHGKKNGKTENGEKSQKNGDEEKDETTESTPRKAETGEKRKAEKPADEDGKDGEKATDEPETKKLKEDDKEAEKPEDEVSEEQDGEPTPTKKRSEQAKSTEKSDD